ncbi:NYN domain-containing protein, partial [Chloroflexota bacterium]
NLFQSFRQQDYLPKTAEWTQLFDYIVSEVVVGGERLRTYWYVIKTMDFYPYHLPNITRPETAEITKQKLKRILSSHDPYRDELANLQGEDCDKRMIEIVKGLEELEASKKERFYGWLEIQDGIASRHKAIEFRRAGAMNCNLFTNQLGREKAVDVKLATDMITLSDIYDVAIIVSGDQDYVPVVEVLKDCGKRVVNVAFKNRGGQLLPGGARRLNQVTDWSFEIPYDTLSQYLKIN